MPRYFLLRVAYLVVATFSLPGSVHAGDVGLNIGGFYSRLNNQATSSWYDSGMGSIEAVFRVKKGEVGLFVDDYFFPVSGTWVNYIFPGILVRGIVKDDHGFTIGMKVDPLFFLIALVNSGTTSSSGNSFFDRFAGVGLDIGYRFGSKGIKFTPQLGLSFFSAPYPYQFTSAAFLAAQRYLSLHAGLLVSF